MGTLLVIILILVGMYFVYINFNDQHVQNKNEILRLNKDKNENFKINQDKLENASNKLRNHIANAEKKELAIKDKLEKFEQLKIELKASYTNGRTWLTCMIAEVEFKLDQELANHLRLKKPPALIASESLKIIAKEKKEWIKKAKDFEYQIKQLEEYFPFLIDYKIAIQEGIFCSLESVDGADPVVKFLDADEFKKLDQMEKEQLALERYMAGGSKNAWEAGIKYERYLGYLYEKNGWSVDYVGAIKGLDDFGRDLIIEKNNEIRVIQAKRWSEKSILHMKHVVQIYGTTVLLNHEKSLLFPAIPMLISTTAFAEDAILVAKSLGVELKIIKYPESYAAIKVHMSRDVEPLYHLPFDQQYDRIKMKLHEGDSFVKSIAEARKLGARRAQKYQFK